MRAMERLWTRGADNILIAPPVKPVTHVGWAAIKQNWERYWAEFAEFKVSMQTSAINIVGPVPWCTAMRTHGVEPKRARSIAAQILEQTSSLSRAKIG